MHTARARAKPQMAYGADVIGVSNMALKSLWRVHAAATRIACASSSTTARLAIGGADYSEADPAVLDVGAPFIRVISKLWDEPKCRAEFARMWHAAADTVMKHGEKWSMMRGLVGMAMLSLLRADAQWTKPFEAELLGHRIDLLATPPKQIAEIFQAHARAALDCKLIARVTDGWDDDARMKARATYRHGINWALARRALKESREACERIALETFLCRGFWTEERKWLAGRLSSATCEGCFEAVATEEHCTHDCGALDAFFNLEGH